MFNCDECHSTVQPYQPVNRVVVEKRPQIYLKRISKGKRRGQVDEIKGWEIVKEREVCPKCYKNITGLEPAKKIVARRQLSRTQRPEFKPRRTRQGWKNPKMRSANTSKQKRKEPVVEKVRNLCSTK